MTSSAGTTALAVSNCGEGTHFFVMLLFQVLSVAKEKVFKGFLFHRKNAMTRARGGQGISKSFKNKKINWLQVDFRKDFNKYFNQSEV